MIKLAVLLWLSIGFLLSVLVTVLDHIERVRRRNYYRAGGWGIAAVIITVLWPFIVAAGLYQFVSKKMKKV